MDALIKLRFEAGGLGLDNTHATDTLTCPSR